MGPTIGGRGGLSTGPVVNPFNGNASPLGRSFLQRKSDQGIRFRTKTHRPDKNKTGPQLIGRREGDQKNVPKSLTFDITTQVEKTIGSPEGGWGNVVNAAGRKNREFRKRC